MTPETQALRAAMDADFTALLAMQGDACLWLDANGVVRREIGHWPRESAGAPILVGRALSELLPPSIVAQLRAQQPGGESARWAVQIGAARHEYLLRVCRLSGNRWLLLARELVVVADRLLEAECARLRARVTDLEQRLQLARDEREQFKARLREEVQRAARRADPVSVLRLDLHDLSLYAERHGEEAAQTVLGTVDQALRRDARTGDYLARWDPQGFAMLLPNTDRVAARLVAERHQRGIGAISWPHDDIGVRVGMATLWSDAADPDDLLRLSQPAH